MKKNKFVPIIALVAASASFSCSAEYCRPVTQPEDNESRVQDQRLDESGHYCLKEDLFVKGHRSLAEGGRIFDVSKIILNISANDVLIDFGGHTAWSDGRLEAGIETTLADKESR